MVSNGQEKEVSTYVAICCWEVNQAGIQLSVGEYTKFFDDIYAIITPRTIMNAKLGCQALTFILVKSLLNKVFISTFTIMNPIELPLYIGGFWGKTFC